MTPPEWTCTYHEPGDSQDELIERLVASCPDLVAVTALTASIHEAYRLSAHLRARGLPVVLGGLHATACPDEAGQHFDSVVVGEGESVWHDLLRDVQTGQLKPRYRGAAPFDLARSPLPRFDLLGPRQRPRMTLQTARGCPLACDFCGASRLLGKFREKPVARIVAELDAIKQVDTSPWLELADDNTFAGNREVEPLFAALADAGARYFTESDSSCQYFAHGPETDVCPSQR